MSARIVEVATRSPYRVHVGRGVLAGVAGDLRTSGAILSDETVAPLYRGRLRGLEAAPLLALAPGEQAKTLATVEQVLEFLAANALDRSSAVVCLGGGVVGDLGGLSASLYMRGIDALQCPTTLLAQVDSSVGGKTGANLAAGKNLAGTIHQPRAVYSDIDCLATLPPAELRSGLGEVVKSALIGDVELLELLERDAERLAPDAADLLTELVHRCVVVKAAIVARDETEAGERQQLNLGHTFAHAIELEAGYGRIPHGEAVAVGLVLAAATSRALGILDDVELPERVSALLARLGLSARLAQLGERHGVALRPAALVDAMRLDKKGRAGSPRFVLPERVGSLALGVEVGGERLVAVLADSAE